MSLLDRFRTKRVTDLAEVERKKAYDLERVRLASQAGREQARRELKNPPSRNKFVDSVSSFAGSRKAFSPSPVFGTPYNPYAKPKPIQPVKVVVKYRKKRRR